MVTFRGRISASRGIFKNSDFVALLSAAAILGPYLASPAVGAPARTFGWHPLILLPAVLLLTALALSLGVRGRGTTTARRLTAGAILVLPTGFFLGLIAGLRSDAFFTSDTLLEVCAIVLVLATIATVLEQRVARGTPADVMARSTAGTCALFLLVFWLLVAINQHYLATAFLLLSLVLMLITIVLRIPGFVVPIYRARRRRLRRKSLPGRNK